MRRLVFILGGSAAALACAVAYWRRNPRLGTRFMNETLDPFLVQRGLAGTGRAEIATLEHVGRRSGTRRLTPVHPVPTDSGFRIVVPLAGASEWARNVLAAGHCRMQLHDTVYDLDEPVLLAPDELGDLPQPVRWLAGKLGVQYLVLHRFDEHPGTLQASKDEAEPALATAMPATAPADPTASVAPAPSASPA